MSIGVPSIWGIVPERSTKLSIVGLAKNVGKTTVLNWLIEESIEHSLTLGLTSIGVDGEAVDVWEGHTKPAIHIQEGMWVATAKAALAESTASFRYVEELKPTSPLGPVYLVQCTKQGTVKLAGTHLITDIEKAQQAFTRHNVTHTLIDGAYDRIAAAQDKVAHGFVLCTGAALDTDIQLAVAKTQSVLARWTLPLWSGEITVDLERVGYLKEGVWLSLSTAHALQFFDDIRLLVAEGLDVLWLPGALTDNMLQKCLAAQSPFSIILDNPTKCFAEQDTLVRWFRKGGTIYVKKKSDLLALAVNPTTAQKAYSNEEWLTEMKKVAGGLPVIDAQRRIIY